MDWAQRIALFIYICIKLIGMLQDKFLQLVRFSMGIDAEPPQGVSDGEWEKIYSLVSAHSLLGICSTGIERMDDSLRPPTKLTRRWAMDTLKIEKTGRLLCRRCVELDETLRRAGTRGCILKGQGAALYYPSPLRRQCGDIDVWVPLSHTELTGKVLASFPAAAPRYHHVDVAMYPDVSVEFHYRPSWASSPWGDAALQAWFRENAEEQFSHRVELPDGNGEISVPTTKFNMVYMMLHISHHLFDEGIGLRQLMDYYYVMERFSREATEAERREVVTAIESVGLASFAHALMCVMRKVFHADGSMLIFEPSEELGRFVLREVMRSGNFGMSSDDIDRSNGKSANYFLTKMRYKLHFFRQFPRETFWNLDFWIYQRLWRMWYGYV